MKSFETEAHNFVLNTAKNHILNDFDKKDKTNRNVNYANYNYGINIQKRCFHNGTNSNDYYEDYFVQFTGIIQNKKINAAFYIEWENKIHESELLPANTRYNPTTNTFYNRQIKIIPVRI